MSNAAGMSDRFWQLWETLRHYGADPRGGASRVGFSDADREAREWLLNGWSEIGLQAHIDGIGNLIGTLGEPPYTLLHSHTDTVPGGGNFDGIVGVLAATVVAELWRPEWGGLRLINWSCEESSRFAVSTIGSRSACGELTAEYLERQDATGLALEAAARSQFGWGGTECFQIRREEIRAALELHIEQGTELAEAGNPMGVVTAIAAPQRWRLTFTGQANHSAGTPMAARHDALAGMAEAILAVESLSRQGEARGMRSTVTRVDAEPGSANVIAGKAHGLIDVRVQSQAVLDWYRDQVQAMVHDIAGRRGLADELIVLSSEQPGALSSGLIEILRERVAAARLPVALLPSWPSHDSLTLSRYVPTGMLFVRNPSGISHNAAESITREDMAVALPVLLDAARTIAERFS